MGTSFASLFKHGSHNQKDHNPHKGYKVRPAHQVLLERILTREEEAESQEEITFDEFRETVTPICSNVMKRNPWMIGRFRSATALATSVTKTHFRMLERTPFSTADIEELEAYAVVTEYRPVILDNLIDNLEVMTAAMEYQGADWLSALYKHAQHNQDDHGNRYPSRAWPVEDSSGQFHIVGTNRSKIKLGEEPTLCGLDTSGMRKAAPFPPGDKRGMVHFERGCMDCIDTMADIADELEKHANHDQKSHGNWARGAGIVNASEGKLYRDPEDPPNMIRGKPDTQEQDLEMVRFTYQGRNIRGRVVRRYLNGKVIVRPRSKAFGDFVVNESEVSPITKHMGPGDHPSGTPQTTHGSGAHGTSGRQMAERLSDTGDLREGFSITPIGGEPAKGGFMVAIPGHELRIPRGTGATADAIAAHRRSAWSAFESTPNSYWGGWADKKNNEIVLDVSVRFEDHATAVEAGREWGQDAIYDLYHFRDIRTDDDGSSYEAWKKEFLDVDGNMIPGDEDE